MLVVNPFSSSYSIYVQLCERYILQFVQAVKLCCNKLEVVRSGDGAGYISVPGRVG